MHILPGDQGDAASYTGGVVSVDTFGGSQGSGALTGLENRATGNAVMVRFHGPPFFLALCTGR